MTEPTFREEMLRLIRMRPGLSAFQIAEILEGRASDVSSACLKLTKKGMLRREPGQGPRGGFGYFFVEP